MTIYVNHRNVLDGLHRGACAISQSRKIRRSIRATIPAYRYGFDRAQQAARSTIGPYRYGLDRMRRVARKIIATFRQAPARLTGPFIHREISDRLHRRIRTTVASYRTALDELGRSIGVTLPFACRAALGRVGSVQTAIATCRDALDRMRRSAADTLSLAYSHVLDRMRGGARTRVLLDDALDRISRSARLTIVSTRHHALDGSRQGLRPVLATCRNAGNRVRSGIRVTVPVVYRYVLDEERRAGRTGIAGYRYTRDRTRQRVRTTVPFIYRSVLEGARRGIRTTVPAYRYAVDSIRRDARATFAFPTFRYGIIAAMSLAVLAPLCLVLYRSFLAAPLSSSNAQPGLAAYQLVFADENFRLAFGSTLLLAAGMTLIAVPLGAILALLMMRTDVPGRHWLEPLILLPIFLPLLILGFGYVEAFGPSGILTSVFNEWAGPVPWNVSSFPFIATLAGLTHVPYVYLCIAAALRALGGDSEAAARSAGAGFWRVAFGVSLPMTTPAIVFAAALVFFLGFELFGLPLVLGDAQGFLVLSTYLYKLANELEAARFGLVAVVIVIMVAISLPLVFIQRIMPLAGYGGLSLNPPKPLRFVPFNLGLWRLPVFLAIALWLAATVLVPLGALALRSFTTTWAADVRFLDALTLDHYRELIGHPGAVRSIVNTLGIGLVGGAAAAGLYTAIALSIHRWRSAWSSAFEYLALVPRAMPGLAAGLALLWLLLFFKLLTPLHGTLVSVWVAYTLVWLSSGTQLISNALVSVNQKFEDIARTVGATEGRMKLDITLPLLRATLPAGWVLIFLLFARDYSTGIYLVESGNEIIGPLLVSLWGSGAIDLVSALSVVNVLLIGAGLFAAGRLGVHLHA